MRKKGASTCDIRVRVEEVEAAEWKEAGLVGERGRKELGCRKGGKGKSKDRIPMRSLISNFFTLKWKRPNLSRKRSLWPNPNRNGAGLLAKEELM